MVNCFDFFHVNSRVNNVFFNAENIQSEKSFVELISIRAFNSFFNNSIVQCPGRYDAETKVEKGHLHFYCKLACDFHSYTNEAGLLTFDVGGELIQENISCIPCPVGANCEGQVTALPNYWGYRDQKSHVQMFRCPEDYCCEDKQSCGKIDQCFAGREGVLCGQCRPNLSVALFSEKCVPKDTCHAGLIVVTHLLCALAYAVFLCLFTTVKEQSQRFAEKCASKCRKRKRSDVEEQGIEMPGTFKQEVVAAEASDIPESSAEHHQATEADTPRNIQAQHQNNIQKEESGLKYLQMLFYHVQDATLFKTSLPSDSVKENVLIRVLQFSPSILSLYWNLSEVCFTYFDTNVAKIVLFSSFGYLVMLFLFIFFGTITFLSQIIAKYANVLAVGKSTILKGFLFALLLSFQQTVKGVFRLVQCVDIQNQNVLFLQGEIECYTWWQVLVQLYTYFNVIPLLLILSCFPFLIQQKRLSVKHFVCSCLLPVPSALFYLFHSSKQSDHTSTQCKSTNSEDHTTEHQSSECMNNHGAPETTVKFIYTENETEIMGSLLKHYRTLQIKGIKFTWLGIHKLYRLLLVACYTYISNPLHKSYAMTALLILFIIGNSICKPYKHNKANVTAILSHTATAVIAMINMQKVMLLTYGCELNCSYKDTMLNYLGFVEHLLLTWFPIIFIALDVGFVCMKKCKKKIKRN